MPTKWEQQEPGWWTSDLGGIVKAGECRWFYHAVFGKGTDAGPFKSLGEAKRHADPSDVTNGDRS